MEGKKPGLVDVGGSLETQGNVDNWRIRSNNDALAEMSLQDVKDIAKANPDSQHAQDLLTLKTTRERSGQTETVMEYLKAFSREVVSASDVTRLHEDFLSYSEAERNHNRPNGLTSMNILRERIGDDAMAAFKAFVEKSGLNGNGIMIKEAPYVAEYLTPGFASFLRREPNCCISNYYQHQLLQGDLNKILQSCVNIPRTMQYVNSKGGFSEVSITPGAIKELVSMLPADLIEQSKQLSEELKKLQPTAQAMGEKDRDFIKFEEIADELRRVEDKLTVAVDRALYFLLSREVDVNRRGSANYFSINKLSLFEPNNQTTYKDGEMNLTANHMFQLIVLKRLEEKASNLRLQQSADQTNFENTGL